jgi:SAM-dependent methyltransferase
VVANFAVLNSIRDPEPLFEAFAQRLAPPGWVIVSILNPIHWTKLRAPRWWLNSMRARGGPAVNLIQPYASYLHFVRGLARSARQFRLMGRANAGNLVRYDEILPEKTQLWWGKEDSRARPGSRVLWSTPAHRLLGHFVFLVFRRDG